MPARLSMEDDVHLGLAMSASVIACAPSGFSTLELFRDYEQG
jgi:hypothetical protein